MMKKLSTLYNYIHLSAWMVLVLVLLLISLIRDAFTSLLKNKEVVKYTQKKYAHNRTPLARKKSTRYIIT